MSFPALPAMPAVSDTPAPLVLLVGAAPEAAAEVLREAGYRVRSAASGATALRLATAMPLPQLILLGAVVAEQDGLELLRRLQGDAATRRIPVLFVGGASGAFDEELALALGAVDCLTLPLRPLVLLARVQVQLRASRQESTLAATRRLGLTALVRLTQLRDAGTGHHMMRTQAYVRVLAEALRQGSAYAGELDDQHFARLVEAAPLHDLGKVGMPDAILHKPGPLTAAEVGVMQTHARLGAEVIARAEADLGEPCDLLALAGQIARSHHEHWDGAGYPDGLRGRATPLAARIVGLADVFDAMTAPRDYLPPLTPDEARRRIVAEAGWQFDPELVRAFDAHFEAFRRIADQTRVQSRAAA